MFEQQIKRGMEFLDEHKPGWEWLIDVDSLNVADGCKCVVGQLYNDRKKGSSGFYNYCEEQKRIALDEGDVVAICKHSSSICASRGFVTSGRHGTCDHEPFEILTSEWREAILARRAEKESESCEVAHEVSVGHSHLELQPA